VLLTDDRPPGFAVSTSQQGVDLGLHLAGASRA
jgi:hypothetical protein